MPKDIQVLKVLALRGASHQFIAITTSELGEDINVSQQTASNRILGLAESGLIERKMGVRGQQLKLTKRGMDILRAEYADYQQIFAPRKELKIRGVVSTGLGEGEYYVGQEGYQSQFEERLGFKPYKGTLNLTVGEEEVQKLVFASPTAMIVIDGFEAGGRSFGRVNCLMARIKDIKCAVVMPRRSHHTEVIEVMSKVKLRNALDLEDGDEVELTVQV